jgi:hypothetical protein
VVGGGDQEGLIHPRVVKVVRDGGQDGGHYLQRGKVMSYLKMEFYIYKKKIHDHTCKDAFHKNPKYYKRKKQAKNFATTKLCYIFGQN